MAPTTMMPAMAIRQTNVREKKNPFKNFLFTRLSISSAVVGEEVTCSSDRRRDKTMLRGALTKLSQVELVTDICLTAPDRK